jgi:hypothetical protein
MTRTSGMNVNTFSLPSGDLIGISCREVNNTTWYQVFQQGQFQTSSFYDGPDKQTAIDMYGELLLAFRGIRSAEEFRKNINIFDRNVSGLIKEYEKKELNYQTLKKDPLFLGISEYSQG